MRPTAASCQRRAWRVHRCRRRPARAKARLARQMGHIRWSFLETTNGPARRGHHFFETFSHSPAIAAIGGRSDKPVGTRTSHRDNGFSERGRTANKDALPACHTNRMTDGGEFPTPRRNPTNLKHMNPISHIDHRCYHYRRSGAGHTRSSSRRSRPSPSLPPLAWPQCRHRPARSGSECGLRRSHHHHHHYHHR